VLLKAHKRNTKVFEFIRLDQDSYFNRSMAEATQTATSPAASLAGFIPMIGVEITTTSIAVPAASRERELIDATWQNDQEITKELWNKTFMQKTVGYQLFEAIAAHYSLESSDQNQNAVNQARAHVLSQASTSV
jgi:hypothetical protein